MSKTALRVPGAAPDKKGRGLARLAGTLRVRGSTGLDSIFIVDAVDFSVVPESPFAYWAGEEGDDDWAHLALRYWPERVREQCRKDRSLAIAQGLEENHQDE